MRIVVIAGYAPSLLNFRGPLLRALLARGHEVIALAPPEEPSPAATESGLGALGVRLLRYPLERGGLDPRRDVQTLFALRRHLLQLQPDLVLAYTVKAVIYGSLAARWSGVVRMASLITGLGYAFGGAAGEASGQPLPRRLLSGLVAGLYRTALRGNRVVLFQNQDDRALFERLGILSPGQRTAVVNGSGVDLAHFAPAPLPQTGPPVFLCMGRLVWAKGVGVFEEACRMLKRQHPRAVCRLLGPADDVPDAVPQEVLERWRTEGVVEILDPVDDVRPHLAACSVFVLPSFREGLPRSVLEAMALGRAVITTDVPGCRETVEPGVTGLLVPPFEPGALMRAMERFLLEPELSAQMGRAGRRLAEERFDARQVALDTLAALPLSEPADRKSVV
jgi:glycosyltransferase involved in cell wall biosynthesis